MQIYKLDKIRNGNKNTYVTRFLFFWRCAQRSKRKILLFFLRRVLTYYYKKYGLEIPIQCQVGGGMYIGHAFNITINPNVVIGRNCNIHKGVVIGQTNRGLKKGTPIIGNEVWIGINSAIVGGVTIGDDVMIAPNSYVNVDVPSHSIVFGNPCVIKHRDNATLGYINNKV